MNETNFVQSSGNPDKQGLKGFLVQDIVKSEKEIQNNICYLCDETSAAVKCNEKNCDRTWHFICGRTDNCITQFTDEFHSYCHKHVPDTNRIKHKGTRCYVCNKLLSVCHPASSIFSSCCYESNIEFGRIEKDMIWSFVCEICMQKYCCNAGYDAMCVMCGMESMTKEEWQKQMRLRGIFIPMQMATWEQDGRFKMHSKQKCGNPSCKYPSLTKNVWTCRVCGCDPQHLKCAGVTSYDEYLCVKCFDQSFVNRVPLL